MKLTTFSPPSSAETKNTWSYTSTSIYLITYGSTKCHKLFSVFVVEVGEMTISLRKFKCNSIIIWTARWKCISSLISHHGSLWHIGYQSFRLRIRIWAITDSSPFPATGHYKGYACFILVPTSKLCNRLRNKLDRFLSKPYRLKIQYTTSISIMSC
jgi:hypothetical protein